MNVHEQAIGWLTARGFYAKRQDWAPGATIIVSQGSRDVGGIDQLDGMIILVWREASWDLQAPLSIPEGGSSMATRPSRPVKRRHASLSTPQVYFAARFLDPAPRLASFSGCLRDLH